MIVSVCLMRLVAMGVLDSEASKGFRLAHGVSLDRLLIDTRGRIVGAGLASRRWVIKARSEEGVAITQPDELNREA